MIRRFFFPVVDNDVSALMDRTSTKNIENISIIVAIFESLTLLFFIFTRSSFGNEEWASIASVLFCIAACFCGYFATRFLLKRNTLNHLQVVLVNTVYYMLMSLWSMWSSHYRYEMGEQILTFYAVEIMLVCFINVKPWFSTILTFASYLTLYLILERCDGATGLNPINYSVLVLVSAIGMWFRYHSLLRTSVATVELQKAKDSEIQDKVNILKAIADIYDKVNLLDFTNNTEMSVRDKEPVRRQIDPEVQKCTSITKEMRKSIMPDQLENFINFTDISTVRERLTGKRLISDDFIDVFDGWIRAQYIPVEADENDVPTQIVFTVRNVDEEKQREERLVRIAMTDELTRLYNRRSYEEDLAGYKENGLDPDFVILTADVNGLKKVNDTMGHVGGDELIKGAADCLLLAVGSKGKVYRTGGDEFTAIMHTQEPKVVCRNIEERVNEWHGEYSPTLSLSVGYASLADNPDLDIDSLEKKADTEMYKAKTRYYEKKGIDRREIKSNG